MTAAAVPSSDWSVREAGPDDVRWLAASLAVELGRNSYFHGVDRALVEHVARCAAVSGWQIRVVAAADDTTEPAGWVLYEPTPTLTVAMAYVEPSYRGLGAWRALREAMGLRDGQLVNVVLAGPQAMGLARKRYVAKHNWGRVLEWLT